MNGLYIYMITLCGIALVGLILGIYLIFHPKATTVKIVNKSEDKKSISSFTYDEFAVYVYSNSIYPVMSYDDFDIYYIDGHYYYFHTGFDKDEFYEVDEVAALDYSCRDDLLIPDSTILSTLFECDVCGEQVMDDRIYYGWYKKAGDR
jgi:hypothetical protein